MHKKIAISVASSGIAATLLDGGKTAHSAFKLPINLNFSETPLCNISKQSDAAHVLKECKLIIVWDEATMAHKGGVEALDRTLQDIRSSNRLMGGMTVLVAGDFRQTLPVVPRGTRADEVRACLKSSYLWPKIQVKSLRVNMRVYLRGDPEAEDFSNLLLQIGNGDLQEDDDRKVNIPNNLCSVVKDLKSLSEQIYPNLNILHSENLTWLNERAILTPKNDTAASINDSLLDQLPTEMAKYSSVDSVVELDDVVNYPVEFLHTLNPPGIPPHNLCLKIGAPIMLLRNLIPPKLCNGTRLRVKTLHKHVIEATIFTGCGRGETVFLPRIPLIPYDYHFQFKRLQFPIKVCFAMTINKAQGQSFKVAGVDLRNDCFSHGQLYVACSRVSSPDSLVILLPEGRTKNIVYKEVL
ncbi:ATP-dependent DNA helicase pif1-like [Metopolophium dirhodum]|uniref:ATP-dependent DNA helicase pif1-like n=1 Tax=Metopolophium dirhodum TaxID=44670 RepID=UPI002990198A|nr:ATP-dependent DNA helicase pif1-like [Metopolophium dirhodum]